jgi:glycosyltransferase involved in cell wall biosynthesis
LYCAHYTHPLERSKSTFEATHLLDLTDMALRILIAAENASAKFGGEAALPLHYFRVLRSRNIPTWLVVHERTRVELQQIYPDQFQYIHYIADTVAHRVLWAISERLPDRLAYVSTSFLMRLLTQWAQRGIIKRLVEAHQIDVVHQPTPVSPKEPSMLFDVGAPVVIGPMNGGMNFPPAFRRMQSKGSDLGIAAGRASAAWLNRLLPGKRRAALLLVANHRTREALPSGINQHVVELVENGVDMNLWLPVASAEDSHAATAKRGPVEFVFLGRLVDWKAVNLLLLAFSKAIQVASTSMTLTIVGDGDQRPALDALSCALELNSDQPRQAGKVYFSGWRSQPECAETLKQADALVLPSLLECGGAVVLEAMAMAIPVIATNWGGPADYLDAQCGILIDPTSSRHDFVGELATALSTLADSQSLRQKMGANGRHRVETMFDWEIKIDRIIDLYQDVVKKGE